MFAADDVLVDFYPWRRLECFAKEKQESCKVYQRDGVLHGGKKVGKAGLLCDVVGNLIRSEFSSCLLT